MSSTIDILMVTYQAPESTRLALGRLLETCDESMQVWLWHNGDHAETLEVVQAFASHPRVARFHHSEENRKLWAPTNWLLTESEADYLSKVDDDNVLPPGWAQSLREAHEDYDRFGVLGCWRFQEEDFVPELAQKKIREYAGRRILQNLWVEGSCFLMKRECRDRRGPLAPKQSFPDYCKLLAIRDGWVNGWLYPFIHYDNLDDPRAENTLIRTEEDFRERMPLTAQYNGVSTIEEWTDQLRRSALVAQRASIDPKDWTGRRHLMRRLRRMTRRLLGRKSKW